MAPRLTKEEFLALAKAGARALLVEMETKKLAVLASFPDLQPTMEGLPTPRMSKTKRGIAGRAQTQARLAWVQTRPRVDSRGFAKRFGCTTSAASQFLQKWHKKGALRRLSPGLYTSTMALPLKAG